MRHAAQTAGALTAAALLTACGGGGDSDANSGAEGELTEVTVGVMPIVDTAAIWLGVDEGIFEEHGLDVTLETAQGGAAIAPSVVSGDYDFGFSNVVSLYIAADEGLPLTLLTPGAATTGDTSNDFSSVLAPADSDISGPADLEGRTVAVNTLNNIGDVTISEVVAQAGGDASTIEFLEMGFPDMPAAVDSGQVDAAWVLEPFSTITQNQGAEVVTHNFAEVDEDLLIAGYFTNEQLVQQDPETVDAFTEAMTASLDYAQENPEEARAILSTYTDIDEEVREQMVMPNFPSEFPQEAMQNLADLSLEHDLISDAVDVSEIIR